MNPPPPTYAEAITMQPKNDKNNGDTVCQQPQNLASLPGPSVIPNDLERKYVRIKNRLIFDFEKVTCYMGQKSGLHPEVKFQVPLEISNKGISAQEWLDWMSELDDIQKLAPSVCGCLFLFCFPGFIAQSLFCAVCCPISMNHCLSCLPCCYGDWHGGLRRWMKNINLTLNKHEMHAKLLTYKPFSKAPHSKFYGDRIAGKNHDYEMSFLAIAVTKEESTTLQSESWDHGVNDHCTSGIGRCL